MSQDEVSVGATYHGSLKEISYARLRAFSGGPFGEEGWPRTNIHTDSDYAKTAGLDKAGAAGVQYQGHVIELIVSVFGNDWLTTGTMKDLRFVAPVPEGLRIRSTFTVVGTTETDAGTVMDLEVGCTDEDGNSLLVGTATALAPTTATAGADADKVMQNA